MIFMLIISLVSIAISICFPFIMFLSNKIYDDCKEAIECEMKLYSKYKNAIEFYLKNNYHFDIKYYTRESYRKYYDLWINIYKTAGTKVVDDIYGVKEIRLYDVNDYTLLSFIDSYEYGFTVYNANNIGVFAPPIDDVDNGNIRVLMQFDLYMKDSAEIMFMQMILDYCNGKLDYFNKLIKGYDDFKFNLFVYGKSVIYNIKYITKYII